MFLDIEDAFDNTFIKCLTAAVENKGIYILPSAEGLPTCSRIGKLRIDQWRDRRSASLLAMSVGKGAFSFFAVSCNRRPSAGIRYACCTATGYADDIIIMGSGKFEGTVSETVQRAMNFVERWRMRHLSYHWPEIGNHLEWESSSLWHTSKGWGRSQ